MSAIVIRMVGGKHVTRKGRGFSPGELKQAGVLRSTAVTLGVMLDLRRSTVHPENVQTLKALANESNRVLSGSKEVSGSAAPDELKEGSKTRKGTETGRTTPRKKKPKRRLS